MSCSFCSDIESVLDMKQEVPHLHFCPVCSSKLPETCTDDEGNIMIVERISTDDKPMSMGINLDEINIDREVYILEQHTGHAEPWMIEYIKQSQRKQIIEYFKNKKKGDKENG